MTNIIGILLLFVSISTLAQRNISNVRIRQVDNRLEILYDCFDIEKGDSIHLVIKNKNSKTLYKPKSLSGNFGRNISSGNNKLIIWDIEKDGIVINEEISAELSLQFQDQSISIPRPNSLEKALLSIPVPGLGNYLLTDKKRPILFVLTSTSVYSFFILSYTLKEVSKDNYKLYLIASDQFVAQEYYKTANINHKFYYVLSKAAIAIWAIDFTAAIINSRRPLRMSQKDKLTFTTNVAFNTPTIGIKYTF